MLLIVVGCLVVMIPLALAVLAGVGLQVFIRRRFMEQLVRIFQEKPLFIIPRGLPVEDAEEVTFPGEGGLKLAGCYLKAKAPRRGVILFGLEFGSDRWSCVPYVESLRLAGYDVFACEPRNQGASGSDDGYDPMQWATRRDLADMRAALAYLKARPDADPDGVGVFGISKGGSVGILAAAEDPYVRCVVTDGAFGTYSVVVPYMRKWVSIYDRNHLSHGLLPAWYYGLVAKAGMRRVEELRGVELLSVEKATRQLKRPLLMIHGEDDRYIKVEMARNVYNQARGLKRLWIVPGAKHNQAIRVAGMTYHELVRRFFDEHLAGLLPEPAAAAATALVPALGTYYAAE